MSNVQDQVNKSLKLVGRVLGDKFKLTACIGIGGSGAVYKADQIALGRTVAVKILNEDLSADARMIKRFRDEAMSASRLNHPNCVSIIDYGQSSDGLLYLAMEYVKGPTLTQLLVNENPLAVDRVVDITMPASVCEMMSSTRSTSSGFSLTSSCVSVGPLTYSIAR